MDWCVCLEEQSENVDGRKEQCSIHYSGEIFWISCMQGELDYSLCDNDIYYVEVNLLLTVF